MAAPHAGDGHVLPPAGPSTSAGAGGLPRSNSAGLSSLSPDEAIHLLQSQVRGQPAECRLCYTHAVLPAAVMWVLDEGKTAALR